LGRLPREQREAIWWVDVIGLPVEDAAARLGIPVGTVKSRCHRGRGRGRGRLRLDPRTRILTRPRAAPSPSGNFSGG
jgi:RNA polymerase sigma-70 factor (ECF subfamily)